MGSFSGILSLFRRNVFNKFKYTARSTNVRFYIYLSFEIAFMTPKRYVRDVVVLCFFRKRRHHITLLNMLTTSGLLILMHDVISLPDAT